MRCIGVAVVRRAVGGKCGHLVHASTSLMSAPIALGVAFSGGMITTSSSAYLVPQRSFVRGKVVDNDDEYFGYIEKLDMVAIRNSMLQRPVADPSLLSDPAALQHKLEGVIATGAVLGVLLGEDLDKPTLDAAYDVMKATGDIIERIQTEDITNGSKLVREDWLEPYMTLCARFAETGDERAALVDPKAP